MRVILVSRGYTFTSMIDTVRNHNGSIITSLAGKFPSSTFAFSSCKVQLSKRKAKIKNSIQRNIGTKMVKEDNKKFIIQCAIHSKSTK